MRLVTTILFLWVSKVVAQTNTNYYLSPSGNNGNAGTSTIAAKRTLTALDTLVNVSTADTVTANIAGGGTYSGTDGLSLNRGKVFVRSYNPSGSGNYNFPILKGTDNFTTGWTLSGAAYTYSQNIPNSITISVNNYAFMYVVEVDTLLERTAPYTARRYLTRVASQAAVEATAGSYYSPVSASPLSPIAMYLHTSDGLSPNNHPNYRYEVVTRDRAVNRNLGGNLGAYVNVEKLITMDYGQGTGNIASRQDSFFMNRCVVMGNAVHQGVYGNYSSITNSAFICGDPEIQEYALVFYQTDGANETNTISGCTFLDDPQVVYSHTSFGGGGGINHGRLNFHNNYCFNASYGVAEVPLTVDTLDLNYVYAYNSGYMTVSSAAAVTMIRNSVMELGSSLIYSNTSTIVSNSVFKSKTTPSTAISLTANQEVDISNSIIYNKTTSDIGGEGGRIIGNSSTNMVRAEHNIFIAQAPTGAATEFAHANTTDGAGTGPDVFDYNAYILISGLPIWKVTNAATNGGDPSIFTFANWKAQSGQDAHSILIDLRENPSGIDQIFINADAGDYRLANTPQADSIRGIMAGMSTPLRTYVTVPTREQLVDDIEQNRFTPVSNLFLSQEGYRRRIQNINFTNQ